MVKSFNTGFFNFDNLFFGKKSKKMWIEHKSAVKVGVDANEIKVDSGKNKVTVTVPKAKVLSVNVDPNSFNANSYSISSTRLRKISAKEQNTAMHNANKDIKKIVSQDPVLMHEAQKRTGKVLSGYFSALMDKTHDKRKLEVSLE
jgi:predicted transcriptional regulator